MLLDAVQRQVQVMESKIDSLSKEVVDLRNLHPYLNKNSRELLYKYAKETGALPNTKVQLLYKSIDVKLDMALYHALQAYTGPELKATSLRRKHCTKSQHGTGKAVDVKPDKAAMSWIASKEGLKWIEEHCLTVYFENIPEAKFRVGRFKPFYKYNPKATGPHIHIALRKT